MVTKFKKIIDRIEKIDPVNYAKNRNFIDGSVTKLSPYISRGVISTKYVFEKILEHNIPFYKIEKFVNMRSSLKFCVIASSEFDLYAARARAREWDYAAGHAIAENAGAIITTHQGKKIKYGKKNFKNPSLLVKRSTKL